MRRLALVFVLACCHVAPHSTAIPHDEAAIVKLVHAFTDAWAQNDVTTLELLLRDDYFHTDIHGQTQDKPRWLAYMRDRRARGITNTVELANEHVRFYGDVAIVTGEDKITSPGEPGKIFRMRSTQVWIRETDGSWRRAIFEGTPIAPE